MTRGETAARVAARALRYAVAAAACGYVVLYAALAVLRLPYPGELEWMEGGSVDHVARVLGGQGLYVRPGLEFIPYQYPPLYYLVSAAVALATGLGFLPLRLVSFTSSLACLAAIHELVRTETRSRFAAAVATGIFAATYRIGGAWLDIARVDSLFLALYLLALLVLRRARAGRAEVPAGLLFGLSFLAKQTALAMCLPVVALVLVQAPRRGLRLAAGVVSVVAVSSLALHLATDGWYTFYVLRFPFLHPWVPSIFVTFWTVDVLRPLPVACAIAAASLLPPLRVEGRTLFWAAAAAGMIAGAWRSRLQTGGYDNVLLPAFAAIAVLCGLGVGALLGSGGGWSARRRALAHAALHAACLVQLALLAYDPRGALPTAGDRRAGGQLLEFLSGVRGEVFLPYHGHLPRLAGQRPFAQYMSVYDVVKVGLPESEALAREHRAAFRERRFAAIVLDEPPTYIFQREIEESYVLAEVLFSDPAVLYPVTGAHTRPHYVYYPRAAAHGARSDVPAGR